MKKKTIKVLALLVMMVTLTGCVKFNANMDIKKDKSMDFKIIYAVDTTYFGNEELLKDEDKKDMEKKGIKVEEYSEGNMKGYTLSRNIANIDAVSTTKDEEYDLSGMLSEEDEGENDYLFKVKKGLLKNTYTANIKFDSSDSDLASDASSLRVENMVDSEDDYSEFDTTDDYSDFGTEDDYSDFDLGDSSNFDSDAMAESMMNNMDLSFNVTIPYKALSHNATSTENGDTKLTWELTTEQADNIKFEFELYNMTTIYIMIAVIVLVIAGVVFTIIKKKKIPATTNLTTQVEQTKNNKFDPNTGLPINNDQNTNQTPSNSFDPNTGMPISNNPTTENTNVNVEQQMNVESTTETSPLMETYNREPQQESTPVDNGFSVSQNLQQSVQSNPQETVETLEEENKSTDMPVMIDDNIND